MGDVYKLFDQAKKPAESPKEPARADGACNAVCGACHHEWLHGEQIPISNPHLKCPNCHRWWGTMKWSIQPKFSWHCKCGEWLFWLTPDGALCRRCGTVTTDWV